MEKRNEFQGTKKWYTSKTLWVNAIALVGVLISRFFGVELTAEESVTILAFINIVLRIITKEELTW